MGFKNRETNDFIYDKSIFSVMRMIDVHKQNDDEKIVAELVKLLEIIGFNKSDIHFYR